MHRVRAANSRFFPFAVLLVLAACVHACTASEERTGNDRSLSGAKSDADKTNDEADDSDDDESCTPKAERSCTCGSKKGTSLCSKAGAWGACDCDAEQGSAPDAGKSSAADAGKTSANAGGDASASADKSKAVLPCDVDALLSKHCGECHGQETAYGAPMSLVTWDDLQKPAPKQKDQTTFALALARMKDDARPMPPAPHARLSAAEVKTLEDWIAGGTPKGSESCTAAGPASADGSDGVVPKPEDCEEVFELRAHAASAPDDKSKFKTSATPSLEGNQYHCFYFDPPYASDSSMYWFQPIIDNKATLHHWILYATDNKTHEAGTSAGCNASEPGAYFVAGWAPGANNSSIPEDVSLQLPTGPKAGLILEVHYFNESGKTQEDASGIRFCTGKKSSRAHLAAVHTLGSEGICINPGAEQTVSGTCAPRADMGDIHINGIWPHMHKLARRMKVIVKRKGGGTEVIHDAPFDFNAQIFHPKNDVIVKPGDTVETQCFFKNDTSGKVHYGERTQDEMCYAFIMAWPAGSLVGAGNATGGFDLLNRCADSLSILQSCNGVLDAPMNVEHP